MLLFKGMISILLVVSSIALSATPAFSVINTVSADYFDCNSLAQFEKADFENAEIITLKGNSLTAKAEKKVFELAQSGTDIFVECDSTSALVENYCSVLNVPSESEIDNFLGVYFHKEGTETKASPVTFNCMYPEDEEVSQEQKLLDYKNIKAKPNITAESLGKTLKKTSFETGSNYSVNSSLLNTDSTLSGGYIYGDLSNLFIHERSYVFAYYNSSEKEVWKYSTSDDYKQIGGAEIEVQLYKIGVALNRNYVDARIISRVYSVDNYYVVNSTTKYGGVGYLMVDADTPDDSTETKITYTYTTTVSSKGETTTGVEYSKEFNPKGISFNGRKYHEDDFEGFTLKAEPASNVRNGAWHYIGTAMLIYNVDATVSFLAGITDLKIRNWKTYTWDEDCPNPALTISLIKNFSSLY